MSKRSIVEGVDRIYDRSIEIENDPDCGCHPKAVIGVDGFVNLALGKIAMLVGYKQTKDGIELPSLGIRVRANNVRDILFRTIQVSGEAIPAYLRFLANESSTVLNAQFLPESALESAQPVPAIESLSGRHPERENAPRSQLLDTLVWGSIGAIVGALVFHKLNQSVKESSAETMRLIDKIAAVAKTPQQNTAASSAHRVPVQGTVRNLD